MTKDPVSKHLCALLGLEIMMSLLTHKNHTTQLSSPEVNTVLFVYHQSKVAPYFQVSNILLLRMIIGNKTLHYVKFDITLKVYCVEKTFHFLRVSVSLEFSNQLVLSVLPRLLNLQYSLTKDLLTRTNCA
jgi:hypothetical protein